MYCIIMFIYVQLNIHNVYPTLPALAVLTRDSTGLRELLFWVWDTKRKSCMKESEEEMNEGGKEG